VLSEAVEALKGMRQLVCWQEQLIRQTLKALGKDPATDADAGSGAALPARARKASRKRSGGKRGSASSGPKRRKRTGGKK